MKKIISILFLLTFFVQSALFASDSPHDLDHDATERSKNCQEKSLSPQNYDHRKSDQRSSCTENYRRKKYQANGRGRSRERHERKPYRDTHTKRSWHNTPSPEHKATGIDEAPNSETVMSLRRCLSDALRDNATLKEHNDQLIKQHSDNIRAIDKLQNEKDDLHKTLLNQLESTRTKITELDNLLKTEQEKNALLEQSKKNWIEHEKNLSARADHLQQKNDTLLKEAQEHQALYQDLQEDFNETTGDLDETKKQLSAFLTSFSTLHETATKSFQELSSRPKTPSYKRRRSVSLSENESTAVTQSDDSGKKFVSEVTEPSKKRQKKDDIEESNAVQQLISLQTHMNVGVTPSLLQSPTTPVQPMTAPTDVNQILQSTSHALEKSTALPASLPQSSFSSLPQSVTKVPAIKFTLKKPASSTPPTFTKISPNNSPLKTKAAASVFNWDTVKFDLELDLKKELIDLESVNDDVTSLAIHNQCEYTANNKPIGNEGVNFGTLPYSYFFQNARFPNVTTLSIRGQVTGLSHVVKQPLFPNIETLILQTYGAFPVKIFKSGRWDQSTTFKNLCIYSAHSQKILSFFDSLGDDLPTSMTSIKIIPTEGFRKRMNLGNLDFSKNLGICEDETHCLTGLRKIVNRLPNLTSFTIDSHNILTKVKGAQSY